MSAIIIEKSEFCARVAVSY